MKEATGFIQSHAGRQGLDAVVNLFICSCQSPNSCTWLHVLAVSCLTNTASKEPFFLYVPFQHTHHPQFAGEMFTNSSIRGKFGDALVSSNVGLLHLLLTVAVTKLFRFSLQNELDSGIGDIMKALNDSGVYSNTLVFFTADNGYVYCHVAAHIHIYFLI